MSQIKKKYPLKRYGQNYLRDENIIRKIISEILPQQNDIIIEIGPGEGALTESFIKNSETVLAVEIDKQNVELLRQKFSNLNLINADFTKLDLHEIYNSYEKKLRVVGNIPYNITSPIIFKLIENRKLIADSVLMVQYEVAKRITAQSGGKDFGILSVICQNFAEVNLCFKVSPNVFHPRPNVNSAVIHLKFRETRTPKSYDELFIKLVKAAFGNRRKMLYNSFKNSIFSTINFNNAGIDLTLRAEKLSLEDFNTLTRFASGQMIQ